MALSLDFAAACSDAFAFVSDVFALFSDAFAFFSDLPALASDRADAWELERALSAYVDAEGIK